MLEQTNDTENVENQTTEEMDEGIELTDTSEEVEENKETIEPEEKEEVKTFTQDEVDAIVQRRLARKEREYQRELSKYKSAEEVLKTGLEAEDISDAEDKLRKFWGEQGIKLPDKDITGLTQEDREDQAVGRYDRLYKEGFESMEEEAEKLANKGYTNLSDYEKILFDKLAKTLTEEKNRKALLEIGAKEEILTDKSFNDFKSKFNYNVPITEIYDMYMKSNKTKTVKENPGSMKNSDVNMPKDYYTPEEISKLSDEQLDDPKIWEAVRKSMVKNGATNYYE